MKGRRGCFLAILGLLLMSGLAQAQLTVIGTATYQSRDYNLIWDDDNNGNSVVWLDYTGYVDVYWQTQKDWVAGLDAQLTYNVDPEYSVIWDDAAWRLPNSVDGVKEYSCDGTATSPTATVGYSFSNSEMGHLYYVELGNHGLKHLVDGSCVDDPAFGLQNTGPFQNLKALWYWSCTESSTNPDCGWGFQFANGSQNVMNFIYVNGYGLALRSGQVVSGSIPTLSEWSQILLVVMLGVSALWMKRRRTMVV